MRRIKLTKGKYAIVDDGDFESVNKYKWYFTHGYARRDMLRKKIYMHRFIMNNPITLIDHINKNTLDNQRNNLRVADKRVNALNAKKRNNCVSRYKGVSFQNQIKRWRAYGAYMGHYIHLGVFSTEEQAYRSRLLWEKSAI